MTSDDAKKEAFVSMKNFFKMFHTTEPGDYLPRISRVFDSWKGAGSSWESAGKSIAKSFSVLHTPIYTSGDTSRLTKLLDNLCNLTEAQEAAAIAQKEYYESKIP